MTTLPATSFFTNGSRTNAEAKSGQDDMLAVHRELQGGDTRTELTIATGAITPTLGIHTVDTEADAATDNLDNILTTNHPDGRLLIISTADSARDVLVRDAQGGAGQIFLADSLNFDLTGTSMRLILQRVGADWVEVGRHFGDQLSAFRDYLGLGTAAVLNTGTAEADIPLVSDAMMQGRKTKYIDPSEMTPTTTNGAALSTFELPTNDVMRVAYAFDDIVSEKIQFGFKFPKSWDEGTVSLRFTWSAAAGAGTVIFGVKATAYGDNDALDVAWGATVDAAADTMLTLNNVHVTGETAAVTIGGSPGSEDYVLFQVIRNIADNLSDDALLLGIELFYTVSDGEDT